MPVLRRTRYISGNTRRGNNNKRGCASQNCADGVESATKKEEEYVMSIKKGSVIILLVIFVLMFDTSASAQSITGGMSSSISVLPGPIVITPNQLNPQLYDLKLWFVSKMSG